MNVLVTGATGFLGRRLVQRLLEEGYTVTAAGRNEAVGRELTLEGARFLPASLEDEQAMLDACRGQSYVFHCGALSTPWGAYRDFYRSNVMGTRHVIAGCRTHGVTRLIHVSTPSLYFQYKDGFGISEASPLPNKPVNHYARTKRMAESLVDEAFAQGLPVVTIRPRALFGPGDNAIFPRLVRANQKKFVPLFRKGQIMMDITYIDNCVDALLLCMRSPESTLGRKYNITNGEPIPFINILEQVFRLLDMPFHHKEIPYKLAYSLAGLMELASKTLLLGKAEPVLTRYTLGTLGFHQTLDITAAREELGYRPSISNEAGIRLFADWWKRMYGQNG
ncbi:NAD-dependent epimerase/dehydratase family protein [Paenibacillus oenotherae]|uniref:NAD-dependent epimerase/dehydratase family protein n=1 Tax=Paenibacillus oenotherae TaxID=1435645 RepID=A0ABS7DB93_9BACL|nr:NAD-dependent epimerase/dehydratase family protein [Paenibacillus oenotherae]MBW7477209.1 NAD-dependent epimerase/dehydratase family protein [Paenibacillus oenotherae]